MIYLCYIKKNIDSDEFISCALRRYTGERSLYPIIRQKGKKPYVENKSIYFSLSHTEAFTVCAVSDHEIGADTEKVRHIKNCDRVLERFTGEKCSDETDFFKKWTAFESKKKLFGQGIFAKMLDEKPSYIYTFNINGNIVSVSSETEDTIVKEHLNMSLFKKADILIPDVKDLTKWSVVACDQYTSQPEYWERVQEFVGEEPSTLKLVYPEAFLSDGDGRIEKINSEMELYLQKGIFKIYKDSFIYVERTLPGGKVRKGIVGAIDLEDYDYNKGAKSAVRATEGTILSRIPARVKIRTGAAIELPHILILIDDFQKKIIETAEKGEMIYDFQLMENGGSIKGYLISGKNADALSEKIDEFSINAPDGLVFAVGDGNHSLAAAKTAWENIKKDISPEKQKDHPARFALVELENIHDDVLEFEPIHRITKNVEEKSFEAEFVKKCGCSLIDRGGQHVTFVNNGVLTDYYMEKASSPLAVGTLQKFLDECGCETDYIHGADVVKKLSENEGTVGFLLPKPEKTALFETVIKDGALPRKTFSMGEANEKRYYLEAKKIK